MARRNIKHKNIIQLSISDCAWPLERDKNGEMLFCSRPAIRPTRYCAAHLPEMFGTRKIPTRLQALIEEARRGEISAK